MKSYGVTIQTKASEQFFSVVLFIMLYNVVLTFETMDKMLWCYHSNESYWAVLSCGTVYYVVQCGYDFWVCGWNPMVWPFKRKLLSSSFLWYCFTVFWVCGWNLMVWPFNWKLLSGSFTLYYLLFCTLQNKIWKLRWSVTSAIFGSEKVHNRATVEPYGRSWKTL